MGEDNKMKIVVRERKDISKGSPVEPGQLWYYDHGDKFYLVKEVVYDQEEDEGHAICDKWDWKKEKWVKDKKDYHRIIHNGTDIEYYRRIYLADGEAPEDAIHTMLEDMMEYITHPSKMDAEEEGDESDETGLMVVHTKDHYENIMEMVQRQRSRVEVIAKMAEKHAEAILWHAQALAKRLHKVMRVIGMLEVYLGVHEEVFQISEGTPAPIGEPICIRQLVLYMDEEAGLARYYNKDGGVVVEPYINFANIEGFDEWLLEDDHLDIVLPEQKGIVALRPSRQTIYYENDDAWTKAEKEAADRMMYLLVRNGNNLYRIWTDLGTGEIFFPTETESAKIAELFESNWTHDRDRAEDERSEWLTNTLLVQGLIDRTEVFYPIEHRINLTDPASYEEGGSIKLIRDAEKILSDGRPTFKKWLEELNDTTERGSRIYFKGIGYEKEEYRSGRFDVYQHWYPAYPDKGVYTIEEVREPSRWRSKLYCFLYLPSDDSYSWENGYQPRKNRRTFKIYKDEFINYDNFTPEDIDYYVQNRLERRHFTDILPLLLGLKEEREEELKQEKAFARLVAQKNDISEETIFELVEWWKRKVINKRPISSDDAKAWRMIVRKAKSKEK